MMHHKSGLAVTRQSYRVRIVRYKASDGIGDVPGDSPRHLPAASRRLPPLRLRRRVLDRSPADRTGIHTGDHLRGVCAGGLSVVKRSQSQPWAIESVQRGTEGVLRYGL